LAKKEIRRFGPLSEGAETHALPFPSNYGLNTNIDLVVSWSHFACCAAMRFTIAEIANCKAGAAGHAKDD
jgi:hypothetical protein